MAEDIRRKIHRGELRPGDQLPSTRQLMEHYDVGNNAILSATTRLEAEGWIECHQGRGRFVRDRACQPPFRPSTERLPSSVPFPQATTRRRPKPGLPVPE
ncbi:winged helix-turn-helix domain-containing protein [Catenuloplanes sp. NPDC051500]|uniref:winged helix-turn-helix domain-containing protein n=1 Tax=Catenuloplanes sp. NPDC051500 TaxID=3363959 RepID=UPI0037A6D3F2